MPRIGRGYFTIIAAQGFLLVHHRGVYQACGHAKSSTTRDGDGRAIRADDETRTRDPHLGKVMRYQLRYIRTVRDTGIEPVTSSVSGKRSPAELNAHNSEVETGIEPVCTVLQTVASPLGHSTVALPPQVPFRLPERMTRLELATLTLAR